MTNQTLLSDKRKKLKCIAGVSNDHLIKKGIKTYVSEHIPGFIYHMYTPSCGAEGLPVLVAVHGISHCAKKQARAFSKYAERYGFVVIAPLFDKQNFPAFQRLGVSQKAVPNYPDTALNTLLDEVGQRTGAVTEQIYLFGYSAGGQFAHRYAMSYPERVNAVAIGAAGWYSFPDQQIPFPRGIRKQTQFRTLEFDPKHFLEIPMATFTGEHDTQRDASFKSSPRLDFQQGTTRIERAKRWVNAMKDSSITYGLNTQYENHIIPSCGHSFTDCVEHGNLDFMVMSYIYEIHHIQRTLSEIRRKNINHYKEYQLAI